MSRRYLLDSNALNDLFHAQKGVDVRATSEVLAGSVLGTCLPVVGEVYAGLEGSASRTRNLPIVERGLRLIRKWPFDLAAAREFGRIKAHLVRIGRLMQPIDIQAAAVAKVIGAIVVSTDSDFLAIPGLRVEDWTKPPAP